MYRFIFYFLKAMQNYFFVCLIPTPNRAQRPLLAAYIEGHLFLVPIQFSPIQQIGG